MAECLFFDDFSDGDMSDWQTAGNAEAPIVEIGVDTNWMRLHAFGAYDPYWKEAFKDIGYLNEKLELKFNWKVYSEAANKSASRTFKLYENDVLKFEKSISDLSYGSAEGTFDEIVSVSGNVRILFGLYGHTYPSFGARTNYLYVTNICVGKYISPVSVNIMSVPADAVIEVDSMQVIGRALVQKTRAQGCGCQNKHAVVW